MVRLGLAQLGDLDVSLHGFLLDLLLAPLGDRAGAEVELEGLCVQLSEVVSALKNF